MLSFVKFLQKSMTIVVIIMYYKHIKSPNLLPRLLGQAARQLFFCEFADGMNGSMHVSYTKPTNNNVDLQLDSYPASYCNKILIILLQYSKNYLYNTYI